MSIFQNVGIDKGDIPDLTKAPSSLLEALEGHLASLEGRKGSAANTPTQSARYEDLMLTFEFYIFDIKNQRNKKNKKKKKLLGFQPF